MSGFPVNYYRTRIDYQSNNMRHITREKSQGLFGTNNTNRYSSRANRSNFCHKDR